MTGNPNNVRLAKRRAETRREIVDAAWAEAREEGLATLTLRGIAHRIDMQAPSLYSHFPSKHAIYDAMFADGWRTFIEHTEQIRPALPDTPRERLQAIASEYVAFAVADLPRHHIMDVRTIPDFTPSAAAYAVALEAFAFMREELASIGIGTEGEIDMYTAVVAGVVSQQLANEPGGTRWVRLLPRLIDMYADSVGVPPPVARRPPTKRTGRGRG